MDALTFLSRASRCRWGKLGEKLALRRRAAIAMPWFAGCGHFGIAADFVAAVAQATRRDWRVLRAGCMEKLKLIALDEADLAILSAHLQDAVLRMGDMTYLPREHRFVAVLNRFDWAGAAREGQNGKAQYERRQTALRIEKVKGAQYQNLPVKDKQQVAELLAVNFETTDLPAGYVTLVFAGGGGIRLAVECIEAVLDDLGPSWPTSRKPEHSNDTPQP